MKRKLFIGAKVFAFVILLCVVLVKCNDVLAIKEQKSRLLSFFEEKKDSLEVVFIGSSHMFVAVYPFQLWEEYGIKSATLGGNSMGVPMGYYCVKEAIQNQHPDVIVVDLYKAFLDMKLENENDIISYTHNIASAFPSDINKLHMLADLIPEEKRIEFVFPLYLYHSRWKELTEEDFVNQDCYTKGTVPLFGTYDASSFIEVPEEEKQEVPKTAMIYIEKIIKVCKENNVEIIFTVLPYETTNETLYHQRTYNKLADELASRNVEYYNFFHMMDEVEDGLDVKTDFFNEGHLNYKGGKKITSYFGKMLSDKGLGTKSNIDSKWKEDVKAWHAQVKSSEIKTINDKNEYLNFIGNGNYEFILMINDSEVLNDYFSLKTVVNNIKLPDGQCVFIYDDGAYGVCSANEEGKIFNGKWVQIVQNGSSVMMLDRESYDFIEDIKIFVYDERLDQIVDIVGINYKEKKVVR